MTIKHNTQTSAQLAAALLLLAGAAWGCGDTVNNPNGTAGAGASGGGGSAGVGGNGGSGVSVGTGGSIGEVETYTVSMGPLPTEPGMEQTVCAVIDAGNESAGMLRRIRTELSAGSHHMIITKIDEGSASPQPTPCAPFGNGGDALFIAEKPSTELTYPAGAGVPFLPHQLIGIEIHYINASSNEPIDVTGTVEFDVSNGDEDLKEVKLLFTGEYSLTLPPQMQTTVESFHGLDPSAEIFALTSHTHSLGTNATIHRSNNGSDTELLHESNNWAEPPFDVFSPAVVLGAGEQLHLRCTYNNPTDQTVTFGTSFYDEMCFLWAHYVQN